MDSMAEQDCVGRNGKEQVCVRGNMAEVRMVDVIPAGAAAWIGRPLTPDCSAAAGFPSLWVASG